MGQRSLYTHRRLGWHPAQDAAAGRFRADVVVDRLEKAGLAGPVSRRPGRPKLPYVALTCAQTMYRIAPSQDTVLRAGNNASERHVRVAKKVGASAALPNGARRLILSSRSSTSPVETRSYCSWSIGVIRLPSCAEDRSSGSAALAFGASALIHATIESPCFPSLLHFRPSGEPQQISASLRP